MKNWTADKGCILDAALPSYGATYAPIPHSVFLNEIQDELTLQKYVIKEERFLTTSDCKILTGTYMISDNSDLELMPSITFVNSYNKIRKAEIRAGAMVLVCKNGMVGTISNGSYARKHTGDALKEFRDHIKIVVSHLKDEFERLMQQKIIMQEREITKKQRAFLLGDMFINEGMINPVQLNIVKREISSSIDFRGDSIWDFYNNVTESFKDTHPAYYDKQHIKFHTYITDKFEIGNNPRSLYGKMDTFEVEQENLSYLPELILE